MDLNPIDAVKSAIQKLSGGQQQKPYISPISNVPQQAFDIANQTRAFNPQAGTIPYQTLLQLAQQYGNKIAPQVNVQYQGQQNPLQAIGGAVSSIAKDIGGGVEKSQAQQGNMTAPVPTGIDAAMNYIKQQTPNGTDPTKYYKALQDPGFMNKIQQADKIRPGLANLLLLQGFHESTLGNKSSNVFGVLPGGEGAGTGASFNSLAAAVDYQLSPQVLGGGALGKGSEMDLLSNQGKPLTLQEINNFYKHYNPEGSYIGTINSILGKSK